ncbi:MAG: thiosulfate oxidation carrier complex protein SoxZ [Gammaproteobacteria bacterium]
MTQSIRLRAREKDGVVTVKSLINHPMETGLRRDRKTGRKVLARYIKEVIAQTGDKIVMQAYWGSAISRNPYLSFKYYGNKGDSLTLSWIDSIGKSDSVTAWVK